MAVAALYGLVASEKHFFSTLIDQLALCVCEIDANQGTEFSHNAHEGHNGSEHVVPFVDLRDLRVRFSFGVLNCVLGTVEPSPYKNPYHG